MILPVELLRIRRRKGNLTALYIGDDEISLAKTLISIYIEYTGKSRGELNEALTNCEMMGYDYKMVRGIASLLEERSVFKSRDVINPLQARMIVFKEVGQKVVAKKEDRERILSTAAFKMNISTYDLEMSLYADLKDEYELLEFKYTTPENLVKYYNTALVAGILVNARIIIIHLEKATREIIQICNSLGICDELDNGTKIKTVLKKTKATGYRSSKISELLSILLSIGNWSITSIVADPSKSKKQYNFKISEDEVEKLGIIPIEPVEVKKTKQMAKKVKKQEIVDVCQEAHRRGITENEVKMEYSAEDFMDFGELIISKKKLKEIYEALENAPNKLFDTYRRILRSLAVKNPVLVLESIGYTIEWNRDREKSLVYRI